MTRYRDHDGKTAEISYDPSELCFVLDVLPPAGDERVHWRFDNRSDAREVLDMLGCCWRYEVDGDE